MGERTVFNASGQTHTVRSRRVIYYAVLSGTGSAQLMFRPARAPWKDADIWLPADVAKTATMLNASVSDLGVLDAGAEMEWRVDVVVTTGTVTIDFFPVVSGG
jgi:hypothetical protein